MGISLAYPLSPPCCGDDGEAAALGSEATLGQREKLASAVMVSEDLQRRPVGWMPTQAAKLGLTRVALSHRQQGYLPGPGPSRQAYAGRSLRLSGLQGEFVRCVQRHAAGAPLPDQHHGLQPAAAVANDSAPPLLTMAEAKLRHPTRRGELRRPHAPMPFRSDLHLGGGLKEPHLACLARIQVSERALDHPPLLQHLKLAREAFLLPPAWIEADEEAVPLTAVEL